MKTATASVIIGLRQAAGAAAEREDPGINTMGEQAVQELPGAYRDVVYLHYYEGYTAPEIAGILGKNVNTVYTQLTRARGLLRQALGGEDDA